MTVQTTNIDRHARCAAEASDHGSSPRISELEVPARSPAAAPAAREVGYRCSENLLPVIRQLNASLVTYQAGQVAVIAPHEADNEKLSLSFANFDQPMGLAVTRDKLAVGTRRQVWFHKAAHEFAGKLREGERGSTCFIARSTVPTPLTRSTRILRS